MARVGKIDDREPAMTESDSGVTVCPNPAAIGAAMMKRRRHGLGSGKPTRIGRVRRQEYSGDSAHASAPSPDRRRHPVSCIRDQADGDREPEDRMPHDQIANPKYADAADQRRESSQPRPAGIEECHRRDPNEAEDGDQSALGKKIEWGIVRLEVRRAVCRGGLNIFWQDLGSPRRHEGNWYFKMRARSQPQHSRLHAAVYGRTPIMDSELRLLP